jgi:hypothetical protein
MNTDELKCILVRALRNTNMRFRGVYAADRVPQTGGQWCCVANTDPQDKPGQHWVALVFGNDSCEYFDPYGLPLETYPALHKRMRSVNVTCQSSSPVQPPLSVTCGHFCIYYLCSRTRLPLGRIVNRLLSIPVRARDSFVLNHVRKLTFTLGVRRPCRSLCKGSQCCRPPEVEK